MMRKKLCELLKRRARRYYELAVKNYEDGFFDLAIVFAEQALQLLLKAMLVERDGTAPRTHSIKILLRKLGIGVKSEKELLILEVLEDAYIAGRYTLKEYDKEVARMVLNYVASFFTREFN
jgi:HEPN domain-containing protein